MTSSQSTADLPAVTASPDDPGAPNGGQWFAVTASPGDTVTLTAQVQNPADEPQSVGLYLTDLTFEDGQPRVGTEGVGVGGWGAFATPRLDLAAHALVRAPFAITVPAGAEPGDHTGAVVAESAPSGTGAVGVVKRVAARLYVTVPGDATAGVEIDDVDVRIESRLVPHRAIVTATVRNTGNVTVEPLVTVNGKRARGATVIVTHDAERFVAPVPVSVLGTRHSFRVDVTATPALASGPTASVTKSVWIVPWWIFLALFLVAIGLATVRELRRRLR